MILKYKSFVLNLNLLYICVYIYKLTTHNKRFNVTVKKCQRKSEFYIYLYIYIYEYIYYIYIYISILLKLH